MTPVASSAAPKASPCRPPGVPPGERRTSRAARWRALALVLVQLAIAAHIALWIASGRAETLAPIEPSEAERFARESIVNTGLIFFALTILSTLVLGRWFCGWACHLVAVQDACRWLLLKVGITPRPLRSRWLTLVPLIAALYLFVWPVVPRLLAGEDLAVRGVELTRDSFWSTFPSWIPAVITFIVCGGLAVYFLGAKGFCTYGCPYGAFFGLADKVAPGRIRVTDACKRCGHCTLTCTSNVDVAREVHEYGMVVDPGCMKCFDCVTVCPEDALYFGFGKPALGARPRVAKQRQVARLPRGEEWFAALSCVYAYVVMRGFNQGSGLLLSVGVAGCFAGFALAVGRTLTRSDAGLPGLALKSSGTLRAAGYGAWGLLLGAAALGVPFGVLPEWNAWRARGEFLALEPTRERWLHAMATLGLEDVTSDERARAIRLARAAERVDDGAWVRSQHNAVRKGWGRLLAGDRTGAAESFRESLAQGEEHPLLWLLVGDASTPLGAAPQPAGVAAYERALELEPGFAAAAARLAEVLRRRAVAEPPDPTAAARAIAVLDRTLAANPDALLLRQQRGLFRFAAGDAAGAEADLAAVVVADTGNAEARLALASVLASGGRPREALRLLEAAPARPSVAGQSGAGSPDPRIAGFAQQLRAALGPE